MTDNNDKHDSNSEEFSDSRELFDTLFGGKKKTSTPSPPAEKKPSPAEKKPVKKTEPPVKTPAKVSKVRKDDTTMKKPDSKEKSPTDSGELFESLLDGAKIEGPPVPKEKKPPSAKKTPVEKVKPSAEAPAKVSKVKTAETAKKKPEPEKKPSPKKEKPAPKRPETKKEAVSAKKVQPTKKIPEKQKETVSPKKVQPTKKAPDKVKEPIKLKKKEAPSQVKPGKRVSPLIIVLAIGVLIALGGLSVHFLGIVDFQELLGFSKPEDKVVTQPNVKKRIQDKRISTRATKPLPVKQKVQEKKEIIKTQKTTPPKKTISDVKQKPVGEIKEKIKEPLKTDKVITEQKPPTVKEPSKPTAPIVAKKDIPKKMPVIKKKSLSYPYSVYLGSYGTLESLQKALSDYQEMGLSPYWVKLDLGDKGTWYRLYSEYFQTRKEADAFIKVKKIPEAKSRKTIYANLIGTFTSEGALNKKRKALLDLKYGPYVIREGKSAFRLYVGAFYQKVRAEKQNAGLASS